MAAATQSRKMHCSATKGNLIAIPGWRPIFFFFFFFHDVCIAAQPMEDQASRLVIPQGDQSPGSSTGVIVSTTEIKKATTMAN